MRSVIVDLVGDAAWRSAAKAHGAAYVPLRPDLWTSTEACEVLVVDGRGCFERGLELISCVLPRTRATVRVLVTERELPLDHQEAYLAGATRVMVMGKGEAGHLALLAELGGRSR